MVYTVLQGKVKLQHGKRRGVVKNHCFCAVLPQVG